MVELIEITMISIISIYFVLSTILFIIDGVYKIDLPIFSVAGGGVLFSIVLVNLVLALIIPLTIIYTLYVIIQLIRGKDYKRIGLYY